MGTNAGVMPPELSSALRALARVPMLLVASDYDGTLAPIVDDPARARPLRDSILALRGLSELPATHAAVISGRALRDLAVMSRLPDEVSLVGSHGSEFDSGVIADLDDEALRLLQQLVGSVNTIAAGAEGLTSEIKPSSITLHYRNANPEDAARALHQIDVGPASWAGVHRRDGHMVVELGVVGTNKGDALEELRHRLGASAVLFVGDDRTDEDAFAHLRGPDIGIKVGAGETVARYRVNSPEVVSEVLATIVKLRREWLYHESAQPIERHSLLSDRRTYAIVDPMARVVWFSHPRPESPSVFAELIGGAGAGYFAVRPAGEANGALRPIAQRYLPGTMTLETRWATFSVTDEMVPGNSSMLVRTLRGTGRAEVFVAPRLDYGRLSTFAELNGDGVHFVGGIHRFEVRSETPIEWEVRVDGVNSTAVATIELAAGDPVELVFGTDLEDPTDTANSEREEWRAWTRRLVLPSRFRQVVERSALALRALTYEPTGAICAAATTSLPEHVGGTRNWDYRFCWLRDAALTATSLARLGSVGEGVSFLNWVSERVEETSGAHRLRPLYTVLGHDAVEASLDHLSGYAGSRPVRIGNAAESQVQLDVFGPLVDLAATLQAKGAKLPARLIHLVEAIVDGVEVSWRQPDHGIWEERLPPAHHTYTKVMCWLAVRRAIDFWETTAREVPDHWPKLIDEIAADVLTNGWNEDVGSFVVSYGSNELDASVLHIGLSGLLEMHDPRFEQTVAAVERELRFGPTVYRYRREDGLPGDEGGFHLCTGWLIQALARAGRQDDAEELYTRLREAVGPTGLMSEEIDPVTERALGNFPQAYSHLAIIDAGLVLQEG
jgi:trehalose-phosphatase